MSNYNKKGLLTKEEDKDREKLIQEKKKAREDSIKNGLKN